MTDAQDEAVRRAKGDPEYRRMLMEDAELAARQEQEGAAELTPMREALGYLDKISPAGWHVERARDVLIAAIAGDGWRCDWVPDDLNPGPECPYCEGQMCARFDGLGCNHDRIERHGYRRSEFDSHPHRSW